MTIVICHVFVSSVFVVPAAFITSGVATLAYIALSALEE